MEPGPLRSRPPALEVKPGRAMRALGELLRNDGLDAFALFDAALELLVRQFMVDHALISRLSQGNLDTFWWVHAGTGAREPLEVHQSLSLCERVLREPEGRLALGSLFPPEGGPGLRAFAGSTLKERGKAVGVVAVLHSQPYVFRPEDLDFIRSVGGLLERALEIENLRFQLAVAQETLALSNAVVEDSALESGESGLPNHRYLDLWLKGHMAHARRQKETVALILWGGVLVPALRQVAASLRGEDLLVELARGRYLLVLPKATREGAEILWARLSRVLGGPPTGATLWLPDQDDLLLRGALRRAELALEEAERGGGLFWKLQTQVEL